MNEIKYAEAESTTGVVSITFGQGEFEILALSLQSKSANHFGFGSAHWYTVESDGTNKVVALLAGWFRSSQPLPLAGTKIVLGPARLYGVCDLPTGAYFLMRVSYRRIK